MMSLKHAAQYVKCRRPCLRDSYAGISHFIRTRHHGTSLQASVASSQGTNRSIATATKPDPKTQEALDSYKASVHPWQWNQITNLHPVWEDAKLEQEVTFCGYLSTRRTVNKNLSFTVLRNIKQDCSIQIVSSGNKEGSQEAVAHARIKTLREWTPVVVKGVLKQRVQPKQKSDAEATREEVPQINSKEIALLSITPLNEVPTDIFINNETVNKPEYRHLQLRTDSLARNRIIKRDLVTREARQHLSTRDFVEVETPLLFKSTPEGAREFLVPTRQKGLAYALPQSPQQYKQILMASGIPKYYQFAKCFRDEGLRADRQPEFTQLDIEMAFADEETIMEEIETLITSIWRKTEATSQKTIDFPRMTYQEAMSSYGSDKPDLRYNAKIQTATTQLESDFINKITPLKNPEVEAFKMALSEDPEVNRKFISDFFDSPEGKAFLKNTDGQPATFCHDAGQPMNGLGPLGYRFTMEPPPELQTAPGDLLVMQARPRGPFTGGSTVLGNLRLALYKAAIAQGLVDAPHPKDYRFVWITDFPLFSPTVDVELGQGGTAGLASTHHPFTAPKTPADLDLLLTEPTKAVAAHYDIVVNGVELGGGSRRIHNAEVQEFIFRDVLKMTSERIEELRHLLDVLRSGCPPHAGIALGWDRLMTLLTGSESLRDVIAFPKNGSGEDVLVKSPNRVTEGQWATYHLSLKK